MSIYDCTFDPICTSTSHRHEPHYQNSFLTSIVSMLHLVLTSFNSTLTRIRTESAFLKFHLSLIHYFSSQFISIHINLLLQLIALNLALYKSKLPHGPGTKVSSDYHGLAILDDWAIEEYRLFPFSLGHFLHDRHR